MKPLTLGALLLLALSWVAGPAAAGHGGCEGLHDAADWGDLDRVETLLLEGVDVDCRSKAGTTALMKAAGELHVAVVQLLLRHGADVNAREDESSLADAYDYAGLTWIVGEPTAQEVRDTDEIIRLLDEARAAK